MIKFTVEALITRPNPFILSCHVYLVSETIYRWKVKIKENHPILDLSHMEITRGSKEMPNALSFFDPIILDIKNLYTFEERVKQLLDAEREVNVQELGLIFLKAIANDFFKLISLFHNYSNYYKAFVSKEWRLNQIASKLSII